MWNLEQYSEKTALVADDGTYMTYNQLNQACDRLFGFIGRRCLVFSLCTNQIGSVAGYLSFLNHKIVPAMLSAHLDRELMDNLLMTYKPAYIWCPIEVRDEFSKFEAVFQEWNYVLFKTGYDEEYKLYDDLALLLTTSGSTGSPKFVRQSYSNILANAKSIAQYLELDETERSITTLPMNYTYGLSIINTHILVGATLLLTDYGLMQKEFWNFLKNEKATSFGGVPYTYEMLEKLRFFRMDLPDLRYMTQAGGKLSPELHRKFAEYAEEKGKKFIVMYGQCEATARMSYLPAEQSLRKYGSMGIAIPGGKFTLVGVDGKEIIDSDAAGELIYEGENVTLGYAECGADLALGDERHGRLETGDMAKRDSEGYYYIVGRKKRFLKVYGNRVNLDEIDIMIKNKFGNIECASGGVDDHVYIFLTDETIAEDVRAYVVGKTGLNQVAFQTKIIDEIPKNDSGKIRYNELLEYIEG